MTTPHNHELIISDEETDEETIDLTNLLNALRDTDWLLEIQPYKQTKLNNQLPFLFEEKNLELESVIVKAFTKPITQTVHSSDSNVKGFGPSNVWTLPLLMGSIYKESSLATLSDEEVEAMTDMFIKAISNLGLDFGSLFFDLNHLLYPLRYLEPTTETTVSSVLTHQQFLIAVYEWHNQVPLEETKLDKNSRDAFYHFMKTTRNMVGYFIISQSLGHENLQTTKIYLEKVMALESHAINSWDDSIFGEYI